MTESQDKVPPLANPRAQETDNMMEDVYIGTAENTFYKSPMVADSYMEPYNTDDLYRKTGDYSIYEDMGKDDQVVVCLSLKKDLVLGSGFSIVDEGDSSEEIKESLEKDLNDNVEYPFMEMVEEILTSYDFGFSITEKIFQRNQEGKICLKKLKTTHPNSWLLHQDDFGNIEKYQQNTAKGYIDIPPKSLIHFINNRRFQNPYGRSDLRAAYAAWFSKRQVIRYYATYLEGAAKPIPVARFDKNAPQSAVDKIFNIIKNFQNKTAMTLPKEIEVEFLEAKTNGEAYSKAIDIFNMFIGRALFIPDLLGVSGSETSGGSFALGKEQINMFFMHINKRRRAIEDVINKHVIKPLVVNNFGFQEKYPQFKLNPLDDIQATEYAKVWLDAMKSKIWKPTEDEINHFRHLLKFPESDIEFYQEQPPPTFGPDGQPLPPNKKPPVDPDELELDDQDDDKKNLEDKKEFKSMKMDVGDYYKKVNFKAVEAKLDDYDNSIMDESKKIINKIYEDLYDQLAKKKIIKSEDLARADNLKLKYLKELKQCLKNSFMQLYKDSQVQASSELLKSEFRAPVLGDEFLRILEDETFNFIGDWSYTVLKNARVQLAAAIKDGKPLSDVIGVLDDEGKKLSATQLERYSRTKHTEVLNKGRLEFFKESGVIAAYQYSAILDNQTSEICSALNGKIFKAGTEPVPPLHFNCRSVLIPITKYEEYTPDTKVGSKPIDQYIEDNKGNGFATR